MLSMAVSTQFLAHLRLKVACMSNDVRATGVELWKQLVEPSDKLRFSEEALEAVHSETRKAILFAVNGLQDHWFSTRVAFVNEFRRHYGRNCLSVALSIKRFGTASDVSLFQLRMSRVEEATGTCFHQLRNKRTKKRRLPALASPTSMSMDMPSLPTKRRRTNDGRDMFDEMTSTAMSDEKLPQIMLVCNHWLRTAEAEAKARCQQARWMMNASTLLRGKPPLYMVLGMCVYACDIVL